MPMLIEEIVMDIYCIGKVLGEPCWLPP